jgi:thymidylate synthase ThyX
MTSIAAKIIADSISPLGVRLTTMQLRYPLVIHGEVMTHRVFSRNARSQRAVPTKKMIEEVRSAPWVPQHIGRNQPGMQAGEALGEADRERIASLWREGAAKAADLADQMLASGAHKQIINRILTPFLWMHTLVSATQWENFYGLRIHDDAEPHMAELAQAMFTAQKGSLPKLLRPGEWHLPYVTDEERGQYAGRPDGLALLIKLSVARCARISYQPFDGDASHAKEIERYDKLVGAQPVHASPAEHQATPDEGTCDGDAVTWRNPLLHGNFIGWRQYRKTLSGEAVAPFARARDRAG